MASFFGRQRECRFYTAGCGNKMAVSVTGPRAVDVSGGPVILGSFLTISEQICITYAVLNVTFPVHVLSMI